MEQVEEAPEEPQPEPALAPVVEEAKEEPAIEEQINEEPASQPSFEVAQEETKPEEPVAQEEQPAKEAAPDGKNKKKKKKGLIIGLAIGGAVILAAGIAVPVSISLLNKQKQQQEELYNTIYKAPVVSKDNKTVQYGLYPQTHVKNESLIKELSAIKKTESNGWYLHEGAYYAKATALPAGTVVKYSFEDGEEIKRNKSYWFKCEPITWNVLKHEENYNRYYLVSNKLLDAQAYDAGEYPSNNYNDCDLRNWLSSKFYQPVFKDKTSILTTSVDNSGSTTDNPLNGYTSSNTQDKIYLLSYADFNNSSYGLSTKASRCCKTTDYARARGAFCVTQEGASQYDGYYWTRSPYSGGYTYAWSVDYDGSMSSKGLVSYSDVSVRPAMTVKISKSSK